MAYLVLARKYRPQTFEDVVGQSHVTRTLQNAISAGRLAHAVLFAGPRGTGKTTVARILAKAMNCEKGPTPTPCNACRSCREITAGHDGDVSEIDGASNNSVDQVRELRENLRYLPTQSRYRIYIIDEVHMLSLAAFNALLKTLEEPPAHVLFMFATTEPHKIPITILSRCQRHDMRRIDLTEITAHLSALMEKEGIRVPGESLWLIARESEGSMRDALSLLDQVMAFATDGAVSPEAVADLLGVIDRRTIFDLTTALLEKDIPRMLDLVEALYNRGMDLRKAYTDLLSHVRDLMVVKIGHAVERLVGVATEEIEWMRGQSSRVSAAFISQLYELLFREEGRLKFASQPRIAMEMALIKAVHLAPAFTIEELIAKLDELQSAGYPWQAPISMAPAGPAKEGPTQAAEPVPKAPSDTPRPDRPAPPAASPADGEPGKLGRVFENLDEAWRRIRSMVTEKAPSLEAALSGSRLLSIEEGVADVELRGSAFSVSLVKENEAILREAAQALLGDIRQVRIRSDGVSMEKEAADRERVAQLKKEAQDHPLVTAVLEQFKGRIVDVSRPEEETT